MRQIIRNVKKLRKEAFWTLKKNINWEAFMYKQRQEKASNNGGDYDISARYILHTTYYTLHATRYTLHATRYMLHNTRYALRIVIKTNETLHTTCYYAHYKLHTRHYTTLHEKQPTKIHKKNLQKSTIESTKQSTTTYEHTGENGEVVEVETIAVEQKKQPVAHEDMREFGLMAV